MWGSNDRNRRGATARAVLLLAGSVIAGATATMPAAAQQAPADANISVPAGSLDAGLRTLSEQSGVQLIFGTGLVAGKTTSGVSGRLSIEQAVAQLLRGTGLTFRVVNGRTIQIELPPPGEEGERVLGAVRVEGTQGDNAPYIAATRGDGIAQLGGIRGRQDQEVDGYRPRVANIGTGAQTALEDIPRSLSVLTPEQIQKQDVVTLDDALRLLPGITVQEIPNSATAAPIRIYSRGNLIQKYQVDGGASRDLSSFGSATLNLDAYDRVELVRGPNALFAAEGSPGGSLNLIRKRPGAAESQSVTLEGGSYDRINAIADYSTPSLFGSPLAFRAVASMRRNGTEFKGVDSTTAMLYGIFDAPLGDDARIEFGAQYNMSDQQGEYDGQVRYLDGTLADFGRTFNATGNTGTFRKASSVETFAKLNIDLHNDWDFETSGYYRNTTSSFVYTQLTFNFLTPTDLRNTNTSFTTRGALPSTANDLGIFSKLAGRFDTFGLKHNVYASLNYTRIDSPVPPQIQLRNARNIGTIASFLNPVYVDANVSADFIEYGAGLSTNVGIVLGDTISWRDIVTVTGTVRRDTGDNRSANQPRFNNVLQTFRLIDAPLSGTWRPSFSATIKPFKRLTLYGSYVDGFTRQDSYFSQSGTAPNFTYEPLAPVTFRNYEAGVKYGADKWLLSVSAYDLQQRNVGQPNFALRTCPTIVGGTPDSICYFPNGSNNRSRGIDAEFNGQIAAGLSIVASVNYNEATSNPPAATVANPNPDRPPLVSVAPQTAANLFVRWTPGFVAGLGIDLGARYKSRYFSSGTQQFPNPTQANPNAIGTAAFEVRQSPYAVADLGVDYQFSKNLGVRLYVENITNKQYLSSIGVRNGNYYGAPRTFLASMKWQNVGDIPADGRSPTTGLAPFGNPADWYAAFDVGYNVAGDLDGTASGKSQDGTTPVRWTFQTKNAPAYAARLGYHFLDNVRGELEVKYRHAEFGSIGGAKVAPFGVCGQTGAIFDGVPFNCDKVPGGTDNWSLMGNVLYDFGGRDSVIRPFIGGGIGASRNSVDFQGKLLGIGGTGPFLFNSNRQTQETIGGVSTKISFTYQAIAGLALRLSDRLSVDAMYRYVAVPGMTFTSYNLDPALGGVFGGTTIVALTPRVGTFKADYNSHMATIGLRWSFGKR